MIQNNYSPAFCGIPIQRTKILKINGNQNITIDATIEKISKNCPEDFNTVQKVVKNWSQKKFKILTQCFNDSFLKAEKHSSHFWLKTEDNDIIGVLQTTNPETATSKRVFKIGYLISKPTDNSDKFQYKGAGKTSLIQAVKMAKENGFQLIRLFSTSNAIKFYEKMGFKKNTTNPAFQNLDCFELNSKNFDSFLKNHNN